MQLPRKVVALGAGSKNTAGVRVVPERKTARLLRFEEGEPGHVIAGRNLKALNLKTRVRPLQLSLNLCQRQPRPSRANPGHLGIKSAVDLLLETHRASGDSEDD